MLCNLASEPAEESECLHAIWSQGRACESCTANCYRRGWGRQRVSTDNERQVAKKLVAKCLCGVILDGGEHSEFCPFPLSEESGEKDKNDWAIIYDAIKSHYEDDGHDEENFRGCTHPKCEGAKRHWYNLNYHPDLTTEGE